MESENKIKVNVSDFLKKFIDDSSIPADGHPVFVLLTGGVGVGKTTVRKQKYSSGYVVIDATEILLHLSGNKTFENMDEKLEEPLQLLGRLLTDEAIKNKRNIIMEVIGSSTDFVNPMIEAMMAIDYKIKLSPVFCDPVESYQRHLKAVAEDPHYLSSYFTQDSHRAWILQAIKTASEKEKA